jgi:hypothetical protein
MVKDMTVSERWLTMGEIVEAQKEGRVSSLLPCACDHSAFPMLPVNSVCRCDPW